MRGLIVSILLGALCFLGLAPHAAAQTSPTPDELIDQLVQINCHGPGLYDYAPYPDLWAVTGDMDPMHRAAQPPDCIPQAMRELVRMGPQALPALLRHLDDPRPLIVKVGSKVDSSEVRLRQQFAMEGHQLFAMEYDARAHIYREGGFPFDFSDQCEEFDCRVADFDEPYAVRVGDVCFVLIGQIVNRELVAARYQMTGFVIVNSPVETPALAAKVRADWTGVDSEGLKAALLADLHTPLRPAPHGKRAFQYDMLTYEQREALVLQDLYAGALRRLRFYYPDVYASLSGDDLVKRQAFEHQEEEDRSRPESSPSPADDEKSIGELTALNCPIPGISDVAIRPGFVAIESSMEDWLPQKPGDRRPPVSCDSNTTIEGLAWQGARILPALLRHLDDKRPTKLVVGERPSRKAGGASGQFYADEYDPRMHAWPFVACGTDTACTAKRPFERPYTVKVGDVCFVLIGQIVNRQLNAVRFQPSNTVMVNSPLEAPELAKRVQADWAGLDSEGLKASLLADLRADTLQGFPDAAAQAAALRVLQEGALLRLRFYFPDTYAALSGADLKKREAFEQAEWDRVK